MIHVSHAQDDVTHYQEEMAKPTNSSWSVAPSTHAEQLNSCCCFRSALKVIYGLDKELNALQRASRASARDMRQSNGQQPVCSVKEMPWQSRSIVFCCEQRRQDKHQGQATSSRSLPHADTDSNRQ